MHFDIKNYLKNNRYHATTLPNTLVSWIIGDGEAPVGLVRVWLEIEFDCGVFYVAWLVWFVWGRWLLLQVGEGKG